jgi:hypothetical protein
MAGRGSLITLLAFLALVTASAGYADPPSVRTRCFYPNELEAWKATPDSRIIYIRAGAGGVYRLGLQDRCPALKYPQSTLVLEAHGSARYCSVLDFDLRVGAPHTPATGCPVKSISLLSRDEVAELPKELRP